MIEISLKTKTPSRSSNPRSLVESESSKHQNKSLLLQNSPDYGWFDSLEDWTALHGLSFCWDGLLRHHAGRKRDPHSWIRLVNRGDLITVGGYTRVIFIEKSLGGRNPERKQMEVGRAGKFRYKKYRSGPKFSFNQPVQYKESQSHRYSAGWLKENLGLDWYFLDLNFLNYGGGGRHVASPHTHTLHLVAQQSIKTPPPLQSGPPCCYKLINCSFQNLLARCLLCVLLFRHLVGSLHPFIVRWRTSRASPKTKVKAGFKILIIIRCITDHLFILKGCPYSLNYFC